jgi:hypothetical protein
MNAFGKIVLVLVALVFLLVGGVFAFILLGSGDDDDASGVRELAVARGPATVEVTVDGESSSWETDGPACRVLSDDSSYIVAMPDVGVSFSLQVGTPEVDQPLDALRRGDEVPASFSAEFSGVNVLVEEADGTVRVTEDLRAGEFEGTSTDGRAVSGSYTC